MTENIKFSDYLSAHMHGEHRTALIGMLNDITVACKKIAIAIDSGALEGNMHSLNTENVQGEVQKALDVITHEIFSETTLTSGFVVGMASEEMENIIEVDEALAPN
ncbi:MAG: fructose-bisphosphatase class I, partial [Methylophilales bacterium 16-45-7]